MNEPVVMGVGMHAFGKYPQEGLRELAFPAIRDALADAGIKATDVQIAYVGNTLGGLITGQEGVRGQVVLRYAGFSNLPIVNIENACSSGATAFFEACLAVRSGLFDVALAVGVEKMYVGDTARSLRALLTAAEVEAFAGSGFQFTAIYAMKAKAYMERWGAKPKHLALVVAKNSRNGARNPYAQFRNPLSVDEVLAARPICEPLTLYMCSSMADGGACAVVASEAFAKRHGCRRPLRVRASVLRSGVFDLDPEQHGPSSNVQAAAAAFEQAGMGPADLGFVEVHDAAAGSEFEHMEALGLCEPGEAYQLLERGETEITGRIPVNPSGGLLARGHAVGATGLAQIAEAVWQIRGDAGERQVKTESGHLPLTGLCLNTGGRVGDERAAYALHILGK